MHISAVPLDILKVIFSFIPYEGKTWLHVLLVSKQWSELALPIFHARYPVACPEIYVFGGRTNIQGSAHNVYRLNRKRNQWEFWIELPLQRTGHCSVMTKNNIYILFGSGDNVPTKISRSSGACQLMKDKRASQSMVRAGCARIGDNVYILGAAQASGLIFNLITEEWSVIPTHFRGQRSQAVVVDGLVYLIDDTLESVTMDIFDPVTLQVTPAPDLPEARLNACLIACGQYIYAVGGCRDYIVKSSCFRYDTKSKKWNTMAEMLNPRASCVAVTDGKYIYALGGTELYTRLPTRITERYNIKEDKWTLFRPLPVPMVDFSAVIVEYW